MPSENEIWKIVWAVSTEQEKRWQRRRVHGTKGREKRIYTQKLDKTFYSLQPESVKFLKSLYHFKIAKNDPH